MKDLTKKKQKIEKNPLQTKRRAKQKKFHNSRIFQRKINILVRSKILKMSNASHNGHQATKKI